MILLQKGTVMDNTNKAFDKVDRVRLHPAVIWGDSGIIGVKAAFEKLLAIMTAEARDGYSDCITITAYDDCSISIQDNGRGIYLGPDSEADLRWQNIFCGVYTMCIFENLFPKDYSLFDESGVSIPRKNTGLSYDDLDLCALQFCSEYMYVTIWRDGFESRLFFKKGRNVGGLTRTISDKPSGTYIHLKFDPEVFSDTVLSKEYLQKCIAQLCEMLPETQIVFNYASNLPLHQNSII